MLIRRPWQVHLLVFVASYGLFLAYLYYSSPVRGVVSYTTGFQQAVQKAERRIFSPLGRSDYQERSNVGNAPGSTAAAALQVGKTFGGAAPSDIASVPMASTLAPDYSSSQAYFHSLDQAVRTDESTGNRISAVAALRQLASNGDPDGTILEALRVATQDGDPAVVAIAQPAYSEALAMKSVH